MLFDTSNEWVESLDPSVRSKLVDLKVARSEYLQAASNVAAMQAEQLRGSSLFNQESYDEYVSEHLEPRRRRVMGLVSAMLKEAVELEKLVSMLPMILTGIMSQVDLELLLNITGIDVDQMMDLKKSIQDFIK